MTGAPPREDVDGARLDLGAFAELVGWGLAPWQLDSLRLETRQTCLVSPRQCGKSRSLSVLAVWWAFRRPRQLVLVVSAGDEAAGRLLRTMRDVVQHPLLAGSVVDETQHRIILSNGSEIRSVPASERQVRGWTVDLLLVDEAAFVSEDLLLSAALPTTAARATARTVLASTPWGTEGAFYSLAMSGLDPASTHTRTFRWALRDATWIAPEVIETARATMSPIRFRAEFEGEWAPAGDAYFDSEDILACVAEYPLTRDGRGAPAVAGLDWGRQRDAHAVAVVGLLDDYGANGYPVAVLAWCETSRRPYGRQMAELEGLAGQWELTVYSETNGVGAYPTEELAQRLPRVRVIGVASTQAAKEDAYGRLAAMLAQRAIVLPSHPELLRQLGGVSAQPTPSGGLRIAAKTESIHDDLPDALALAVAGLPRQLATVPPREEPEGQEWAQTQGGIRVPVPIATTRPDLSWFSAWADLVTCEGCGNPYLPAHKACPHCHREGTHEVQPMGGEPATGASDGEAVPVPNAYAPDLMRCPAGHTFLGKYHEKCPQCRGGASGSRSHSALPGPFGRSRGAALCRGVIRAVGRILGRRGNWLDSGNPPRISQHAGGRYRVAGSEHLHTRQRICPYGLTAARADHAHYAALCVSKRRPVNRRLITLPVTRPASMTAGQVKISASHRELPGTFPRAELRITRRHATKHLHAVRQQTEDALHHGIGKFFRRTRQPVMRLPAASNTEGKPVKADGKFGGPLLRIVKSQGDYSALG